MKYTVEFNRYHINSGKEILLLTTICADDPTKLKRQVTKLSREVKPFAELQGEYPQAWHTSGYSKNESYSKKWSEFTQGSPVRDGYIYNIYVKPSSNLLDAASRKVYAAMRKLREAKEEIQKRHSNDADFSNIDPELQTMINEKLPDQIEALVQNFNAVETRMNEKIKELDEKTE